MEELKENTQLPALHICRQLLDMSHKLLRCGRCMVKNTVSCLL